MQTEFTCDNTGCFKPGIMYKEFGEKDFKPFDQLPENSRKILFMLFCDNRELKKIIDYQRSRGNTNRDTLLQYVITKKFAGLSKTWDINDNYTLNFD